MMSKISYGDSPIGDYFDFFGLDLVVNSVETFVDYFNGDTKVHIDAQVASKSRKYPTQVNPFNIKRVIFNGPATIVFWNDGTKTVVKCAEEEIYNKRTAIMWAIMKKAYGNSSRVNKAFDEFIEGDETTGDNINDDFSADSSLRSAVTNLINSMYGLKSAQK